MRLKYLRLDELFKHAETTTVLADVREAMRKKRAEYIIDPDELRRQQDWSYLNSQVVGAEVPEQRQ